MVRVFLLFIVLGFVVAWFLRSWFRGRGLRHDMKMYRDLGLDVGFVRVR